MTVTNKNRPKVVVLYRRTVSRNDDTISNRTTNEGREFDKHLARFCEGELVGNEDNRCATCVFRAGVHFANGSPETLITALKGMMERDAFRCHKRDPPCAG